MSRIIQVSDEQLADWDGRPSLIPTLPASDRMALVALCYSPEGVATVHLTNSAEDAWQLYKDHVKYFPPRILFFKVLRSNLTPFLQ